MEREVARRIVGALRAHANRASAQALVAGWEWATAPTDYTDEDFVRSGWADIAARDLAYEAADFINEVLGLESFSGPHGGDDDRAKLARFIAWHIQDKVRDSFGYVTRSSGWESEFPPEE